MPDLIFKCATRLACLTAFALALQSCTSTDQNKTTSRSLPAKTDSTSLTTVPVVPVTADVLEQAIELPAELQPFRDVKIHAKLKGFVSRMYVDRGSHVRSGQVLMLLSAPELDAQVNELKARAASARSAQAESLSALEADKASYVETKAKLDADTLTLERLKKAAHEPGAIAQNEIDGAQKTVEGDSARLQSAQSKIAAAQSVVAAKLQAAKAAEESLHCLEATRDYLVIKSPMNGIITERWVHEGDMAGNESGRGTDVHPLLRLAETSTLRLVVSVPEAEVAGIGQGQILTFSVPAYMGKQFFGKVSRIAHALDVETRTMPVELDVENNKGELEPGMYATVKWQCRRPYTTLFVPTSAVSTTIEKTFVVAVKDGRTVIVPVKTGKTMGDKVEVSGALAQGDMIMLNGSDEFKEGTALSTRAATAKEIESACRHRTASTGE